jgi:hypothetical protein
MGKMPSGRAAGAPPERRRLAQARLAGAIFLAGLAAFSCARSHGQPTPTSLTYAAAWAMSDQDRMHTLVPAAGEPLPKIITINGESATFLAYAAAGASDWKTVWEPTGGQGAHAMRDELKMIRPGPGLTILYGQPGGDKSFVFGTITISPPWGEKRTVTVHDDAFKKSSLEPLHLNPNAATPK